jgi:predicted RNase H-like HicB family nuclease
MKYAVIIGRVPGSNYSAYVPDLPGGSTGATLEKVRQNIREVIEFHLEGMREDGTGRRPEPDPRHLPCKQFYSAERSSPRCPYRLASSPCGPTCAASVGVVCRMPYLQHRAHS